MNNHTCCGRYVTHFLDDNENFGTLFKSLQEEYSLAFPIALSV